MCSSWQASIDSISSSQDPTGGFQARALIGGVAEAGWLSLRLFLEPLVGAVEEGRPRFLVLMAVLASCIIFSSPPTPRKYSSRTSEAFSLIEQARLDTPVAHLKMFYYPMAATHLKLSVVSQVRSPAFSYPSHLTSYLTVFWRDEWWAPLRA